MYSFKESNEGLIVTHISTDISVKYYKGVTTVISTFYDNNNMLQNILIEELTKQAQEYKS